MISQDDEMSIRKQAELLGVNRSTFYYCSDNWVAAAELDS